MNEMERRSGERHQDIKKECISRYGIEQKKMERITCGSSGSTMTVKLRKKKKKKKKKHDLLNNQVLLIYICKNVSITIKLI